MNGIFCAGVGILCPVRDGREEGGGILWVLVPVPGVSTRPWLGCGWSFGASVDDDEVA